MVDLKESLKVAATKEVLIWAAVVQKINSLTNLFFYCWLKARNFSSFNIRKYIRSLITLLIRIMLEPLIVSVVVDCWLRKLLMLPQQVHHVSSHLPVTLWARECLIIAAADHQLVHMQLKILTWWKLPPLSVSGKEWTRLVSALNTNKPLSVSLSLYSKHRVTEKHPPLCGDIDIM